MFCTVPLAYTPTTTLFLHPFTKHFFSCTVPLQTPPVCALFFALITLPSLDLPPPPSFFYLDDDNTTFYALV